MQTKRELAAAYDRWYGQWAGFATDEYEKEPFSYHHAALAVSDGVFVGSSVLDIGCGDGRLSRQLLLRGAQRVTAMDISEVALEIARTACADLDGPLSFEQGDIESIPHPTASFDVAFCCETLEHVMRPRAALAELKRVLKPDGALVVTTPNYLSVLGLRRLAIRLRTGTYTEGGQPMNRFTMWPRTSWWLRRSGFRVDRSATARFSSQTAVRAAPS